MGRAPGDHGAVPLARVERPHKRLPMRPREAGAGRQNRRVPVNTQRRSHVSRRMRFILNHGIDRVAAGIGAFVALYLTPERAGLVSWAGSAVILVFVALAVRPE